MKSQALFRTFLLFFLLIGSFLYSKEPLTLQWLEDKPRSVAKDFYIWQFLQQDITPEEVALALGEAKNVNSTLFALYAKKINHDETYAVFQCMNASAVELLSTSSDCLSLGLTPSKALTLNYQEKKVAMDILQTKYPQHVSVLKILNAPLPFTKLLATSPELFFEVFNGINMDFIEKHLNYKIPSNILLKLSSFPQFNQTIKRITTNNALNNLQETLLIPFENESLHQLTSQSLFFLAINALKHEQKELALPFLEHAYNKAYFKKDKDKILFWKYKITQDSQMLETLSNSYDINLYSLYAKELLKKKITNIQYDINILQKEKPTAFNTTDPFAWIEILNSPLKSALEYETLFNTKETLPHLAYMYEKLSNYQTFYFITPYKEYFKTYDVKRQALMYALAKKESHFIPTAISSSFALGAMQIMPFLSQNIANAHKETYAIYDQFNPKINLKYANYHLDYLEKHLVNPLYIAYAYNGGIGFMKRTIQKGFAQSQNSFEPFLSMELMSNDESREYGKQVLANYYIYINYLDQKNKVKLTTLLENLSHNFPK
jgi:soluble lytic murein transglycosylase